MAGYSGLRELASQNAAIFEEVRHLIVGREDPYYIGAQIGSNSLSGQEKLKELDNMVKMAKILQQVTASLAATYFVINPSPSQRLPERTTVE